MDPFGLKGDWLDRLEGKFNKGVRSLGELGHEVVKEFKRWQNRSEDFKAETVEVAVVKKVEATAWEQTKTFCSAFVDEGYTQLEAIVKIVVDEGDAREGFKKHIVSLFSNPEVKDLSGIDASDLGEQYYEGIERNDTLTSVDAVGRLAFRLAEVLYGGKKTDCPSGTTRMRSSGASGKHVPRNPKDAVNKDLLEQTGMNRTTPQSQGRQGRAENLWQYEVDSKQPKHVRGWMRQERNRAIQAAKNGEIYEPRTPPGYVQAHGRTTPARHGYDYSNTTLQGRDLNMLEERIRRRQNIP